MADKRISIGPGIAVYPRLKTPDTKFDELGIYKADIAVPAAEASDLMKELQAIHKEHTGKPAPAAENTMWVKELDDAGEETGNVVFKVRVKNRRTKKGELWDRRPIQFDAALQPIDVNPWGGSKMVVSASVYLWDNGTKKGISLQPVGVQILELVQGDGPSAAGMGFAAQSGYVASSSAESEDQEDYDTAADDDADDDHGGDY